MASSHTNSANTLESFEGNRTEGKSVRLQKSKGLRARETGKTVNLVVEEADENKYAELKPGNSKKGIAQRPPLVTIPGLTKPSFFVYCDDDEVAQDGCNEEVYHKTVEEKCTPEAATDFSAWHQDQDENVDPDGSAVLESVSSDFQMPTQGESSAFEENRNCGKKIDDDDEDIFLSAIEDDSSAFHTATAEQIPGKIQLRQDELVSCHPDYEKDVYRYMRERELSVRANPRYFNKQTEVSSEMRIILVDWLIDVTVEYNLCLESLHLAVSIIDRMLSAVFCPRMKLQLVGATAIMIATKYEEVYPPDIKEFAYITDETYNIHQILRMEKVVLGSLRFDVSAPTSYWFAMRIVRRVQCTKQTQNTMDYLLELTLLDFHYLRYKPSVLACAAFCLANVITGFLPWSTELESYTDVSKEDMAAPLSNLLTSFKEAPQAEHRAVYEKYCDIKYGSVACLCPPKSLPVDSFA